MILPLRIFIIAMILIVVAGLSYVGAMKYLLNQDPSKTDWAKLGPVTTAPISFNLEINNPDDNIVVFDKSLVVSGQTSPKSSVIITNNDANIGLETNEKGEFSRVLDLYPGINEITISSFDITGSSKTENRLVFYSEEKI